MEGQKNRKYKPYNSLISMDGKVNYCRFVLCIKLHEKRAIRREKAVSVKRVENGDFSKNRKGGTKGKFSKMADLFGKLWNAKKIGNTRRIIAQLVRMES